METYIPLADFEPLGTYCQTFLVSSIRKATTSDGRLYARISFKDITGSIEGVVWNFDDNLRVGDWIKTTVNISTYRGKLEFSTDSKYCTVLEEAPLNRHDYIVGVSDSTLSEFTLGVETYANSITDSSYQELMGVAIHKLDLIHNLRTAPYGLAGALAYPGGLLQHVYYSLTYTQPLMSTPAINRDLVVMGCLMRNIGWFTTTQFQGGILRPRDAHYMTGILRASARYIDHLMLTCETDVSIIIPEEKKQALENMCNIPQEIHTLEGKIVACANQMSDIVLFGLDALNHKKKGNWRDDFYVGHTS